MKKYKLHIVWAIVVIAALVGGFFWGKSAGASASLAARAGGAGRFAFASSTAGGFAGRTGAAGAAGGLTVGQVTALGSDSFTLQLANGNSENIFFSSSTQIVEPQPVSISAIQSGTNVMITGTANSDGSMTATTIQVRSAPTQP